MIHKLNLKSLRDYATVISGTSISRGLSFLCSVLIARWLGAESFGIYSLFFITSTLTWQFAQSFDITFIRKAKTLQDDEQKKDFLRASLALKAAYALAALVVAGFGAELLATYVFYKPKLSDALFYGIISGIFVAFLRTQGAFYQLNEQYRLYSFNYLIYTGSIFLVLLVSWFFFPSMNVHMVILIFTVVSAIVGVGSILHLFSHEVDFKAIKTAAITDSFATGKWVFGVTIFYNLFVRLDVLLIARFVDFRELGIYSVAAQFIMVISLFTGAMSGIFLTKSLVAVSSKAKMVSYIHEVALPVALILAAIVGLFAFAPIIISLFFGKEYAGAAFLLRILLVGWIFQSLYLPLQYIFYGLDLTRFRFFLELSKVLILTLLLFVFVPAFGAIGGAWAISLVYAFNMIVSVLVVYKVCMVRFSSAAGCASLG